MIKYTPMQYLAIDIIYHKRDVNGEIRYVWIDEME